MTSVVASVRERLTSEGLFKRTGGLAELSRAMEAGQFAEDAYVGLVGRESAENTTSTFKHTQRSEVRFAVVQIHRTRNRSPRDDFADDVEAKSDAVINTLAGWTPSPQMDPVAHATGATLEVVPGFVIWSDEFTTAYHIRTDQR